MKLLIALILSFVAIQPNARAVGGGASGDAAGAAIFVGAMAGTTAAVGANLYKQLFAMELNDWKLSATDSTASFDSACGVVTETRLLGTARDNFVIVAISNKNAEPIVVKPEEIRTVFQSGRERVASFQTIVDHVEIKSGWRAFMIIPLPTKWDFKDQDELSVNVPLYKKEDGPYCTLEAKKKRDPSVERLASTYMERGTLYETFGVGSSMFKTGSLSKLSDPIGVAVDFSLYTYGVHHGMFLGFTIDGHGKGNGSEWQSASGNSPTTDPGLVQFTGFIGYSYRTYVLRKLQVSGDLGIAAYSFEYSKAGQSNKANADTTAMITRLNSDYRFAQIPGRMGLPMEFIVGLSLYNLWLPGGSAGTASMAGTSTGLIARVGFGF